MMENLMMTNTGTSPEIKPGMRLMTLTKAKSFNFVRAYCKVKIIDSTGVIQVRDADFAAHDSFVFTFGQDVEWIDVITEPASTAANSYFYIGDTNSSLIEINSWSDYNLRRIQISSSSITKLPTYLPRSITSLANLTNSPVFNSDITEWDTSNVVNLDAAFMGCSKFNQDIGNWNVSRVTSMLNTFNGCSDFNQSLNSWDVGKVTTFQSMFDGCGKLNQLFDNWNTSSGTNFTSIFGKCPLFNSPLNTWDVSKAVFMGGLFSGCVNFNQPLNNWNTVSATNMASLLNGCSKFNQDISKWNVSKVTNRTNYDLGTTSWLSAYKPKFV